MPPQGCKNPQCSDHSIFAKRLCYKCVSAKIRKHLDNSSITEPSAAYMKGFQDGMNKVLAELEQFRFKLGNRSVFDD